MPRAFESVLRKAAVLLAAAFCGIVPAPVVAHDPGLSSLDVRIGSDRIVVTLSLSAADVKTLAAGSGGDPERLAAQAIELSVDGARLPLAVDESSRVDDGGTRVRMSSAAPSGRQLAVRSRVAERLAPGHRQLVTVTSADGRLRAERMTDAQSPEMKVTLEAAPHRIDTGRQFFNLGVRHILTGYDHLLFLAALLLGVRRPAAIAWTVTAFTIAHSITLASAVLGFVRAPAAIVEPLIAASIVFVGLENLLRDQLDSRWRTTFAFGLLHGFGFASALQEVGVGSGGTGITIPLASFNVGVEAGQIGVAMLAWPLVDYLNARPALRLRLSPVLSALVVFAGVYWLVERTLG